MCLGCTSAKSRGKQKSERLTSLLDGRWMLVSVDNLEACVTAVKDPDPMHQLHQIFLPGQTRVIVKWITEATQETPEQWSYKLDLPACGINIENRYKMGELEDSHLMENRNRATFVYTHPDIHRVVAYFQLKKSGSKVTLKHEVFPADPDTTTTTFTCKGVVAKMICKRIPDREYPDFQ